MARGSKTPVAAVTHIGQLIADPNNRRKHNPRNIGMVVDALHQVGAARSIVIDEHNVILAGNGVTEAAGEAGITKVRVVDADGDELIAVRRTGLSDDQKRHLAIADNRAAELAEWDSDQLRDDVAAGLSLSQWFTDDELAVRLARSESAAGRTDPDDIPRERDTSILPGDVFRLGPHRIMCGDSTVPQDVGALTGDSGPGMMVTDPPYGVSYDPSWRNDAGVSSSKRLGKVANDDRSDWSDAWRLFQGEVCYVWHAGLFASVVASSLLNTGFELRSQIVWRKPRLVLSRGHYHWQHEPCWYAVRKGSSARWSGKRNQATVWSVAPRLHRCQSCGSLELDSSDIVASTIWEIDQKDDTGETTHGTQKPVECMARAMRNHDVLGVYDPFGGSGTTLIAAEIVGRAAYVMELTPRYVQMAIDRWEAFTGQKAEKVGEVVPV